MIDFIEKFYLFFIYYVSFYFIYNEYIIFNIYRILFYLFINLFIQDFYSGILHIVLDEPKNVNLIIIGERAHRFQVHHTCPYLIYKKDLIKQLLEIKFIYIYINDNIFREIIKYNTKLYNRVCIIWNIST